MPLRRIAFHRLDGHHHRRPPERPARPARTAVVAADEVNGAGNFPHQTKTRPFPGRVFVEKLNSGRALGYLRPLALLSAMAFSRRALWICRKPPFGPGTAPRTRR